MNSNHLISVIVPTYHRNDLLAKCLDCLAPGIQTLPAEQYEVIVTDDGSETTAQEMIQELYPWARWTPGPRKGPAANRNNGVKCTQGQWLAFTDDDCLPDTQWLESYANAIVNEPTCLVFEGRIYADRPRRSLAETSPANESGGFLWSCNFLIQKQLFECLAGFDERFPYAAMEDVEFRLRLTQNKYNFSYVDAASVCHPLRYTGGWKKRQQHNLSTFIYLSIHPEESMKINSIYYLKLSLLGLIKGIPLILKLKGRGAKEFLIECVAFFQMAIFLGLKNNWFFKKSLIKH